MQHEDPILLRQYHRAPQNRIANQINSRMSPGATSGAGKLSHSPGHWKKYITSQTNLRSPRRQTNSANSNAQQKYEFTGREPAYRGVTGIGHQQQESQMSKFEEQKRRKEDMMRRVEEIQRKVNPILSRERGGDEIDENYGWDHRMEQRLLKLETHIDMIQKQMHIKIERRLLEVQRQWNDRIQNLLASTQPQKQKPLTKVSSKPKLLQNGTKNDDQSEQRRYRRPPNHTVHSQQGNRNYRQLEEIRREVKDDSEGYFTKREHEDEENGQDIR